MINTLPLEQIDEVSLTALISGTASETRILEFKRDMIGGKDDEKKEFLKDISALANTMGGDVIIGMAEADGVASELTGFTANPDEEIRRLEAILHSCIEPRLHGVRMHPVGLSSGGHALVIRVPQSWNPPHRVNFKGWTKFFARGDRQVYEMDVDHLRGAFLGAADAERRLTDFRVERIAKVKSGQTQVDLSHGQFVLHLCPVQTGTGINLMGLSGREIDSLRPLQSIIFEGYSPGWNLDGLHVVSSLGEGAAWPSTAQVFRNGNVEMVFARMLFERSEDQPRSLAYVVISEMAERVPLAVRTLVARGVAGPFVLMVSVLGVKNSTMARETRRFPSVVSNRSHDDLLLPSIILDDLTFGAGWQAKLRPMLDAWWNAYGLPSCSDYFDAAGNWAPPRI